ncbi:Uncharacterised protein [Mycobacteroides abscessus subsp. abscessus]|nr:Uncharacterised protein [Mycobacteroides abscessus subsp. abscessus]
MRTNRSPVNATDAGIAETGLYSMTAGGASSVMPIALTCAEEPSVA